MNADSARLIFQSVARGADSISGVQLTEVLQLLGWRQQSRHEIQISQLLEIMDCRLQIDFQRFLHLYYVVIRADFHDVCSVLFYLQDTMHLGTIDQLDFFLILRYLGLQTTREEVAELCGGVTELTAEFYFTLVSVLRQALLQTVRSNTSAQIAGADARL